MVHLLRTRTPALVVEIEAEIQEQGLAVPERNAMPTQYKVIDVCLDRSTLVALQPRSIMYMSLEGPPSDVKQVLSQSDARDSHSCQTSG